MRRVDLAGMRGHRRPFRSEFRGGTRHRGRDLTDLPGDMAPIPAGRRTLDEVAAGEMQILAIDGCFVSGDTGQGCGAGSDAVDRHVVRVAVDAVRVVVDGLRPLPYAQISHPTGKRRDVRSP